jgi:hypothetical protein
MVHRKFYSIFCCCLLILFTISCTRYERQVVPFKLPAGYPNVTNVAGAQIAAKSYDKKDAETAFGFDILGSGVKPVQVVFDNQGQNSIEIVPDRTYLVDTDNNLWPILDARMAYDRIEKKTELGEVAPKGAKYGALGGIAGGIIGAAIGIVSGQSVGETAMRGAAAGAAGGVLIGGAQGMDNSEVRHQIREDLQTRTLENRGIKPKEIAHGFIFFPGESKKPKEIRLSVKDLGTGKEYPLILKLEEPSK